MSDCDYQKNIKKPDPTVDDVKKPTWDRHTVASTVAKKPAYDQRGCHGNPNIFWSRGSRRRTTECITHFHIFGILNVIADSLPE